MKGVAVVALFGRDKYPLELSAPFVRSFATRCLTNSNVSFSTKLETIDFFYYICTYMVYVVCLDIFNYSRILIFFKIQLSKK